MPTASISMPCTRRCSRRATSKSPADVSASTKTKSPGLVSAPKVTIMACWTPAVMTTDSESISKPHSAIHFAPAARCRGSSCGAW